MPRSLRGKRRRGIWFMSFPILVLIQRKKTLFRFNNSMIFFSLRKKETTSTISSSGKMFDDYREGVLVERNISGSFDPGFVEKPDDSQKNVNSNQICRLIYLL